MPRNAFLDFCTGRLSKRQSRNAFLDFCTGRLSKRAYMILVPVFIAVFYLFMIIAASQYPGYDWLVMTISSLGDPDKNPFPGYLFFSLAVGWTGIIMLPFYMKVFRQLKQTSSIGAKIMRASCIVSSAGLIMLGCFSERQETAILHYIAAGLSFGGFFGAAITWWIIIGMYLKKNNHFGINVPTLLYFIMIATLFCTIIGMAVSQALASPGYNPMLASWCMNFAFWEWTCVHAINLQLFLLACMIPEAV